MKEIKRAQFTDEQLKVIDNTNSLEIVYNSLLELSVDENIALNRKRFLMFRVLVDFMRVRKGDLLLVGIKSKVADDIIKNEIKTLSDITKELKNVIS